MMKSEKGFALAEVMVAIAVLGIVSVALLSGISTAYRAVSIADERATAESLARSQMEYVKSQDYDTQHVPPQYFKIPDIDIPAGYNIAGYDGDINVFRAERLDPKEDGFSTDDGLQRITVKVSFPERVDVTLVGYKSWR
jgi:prepilin-type N-terminal cleavage/methylation domain-containing protein